MVYNYNSILVWSRTNILWLISWNESLEIFLVMKTLDLLKKKSRKILVQVHAALNNSNCAIDFIVYRSFRNYALHPAIFKKRSCLLLIAWKYSSPFFHIWVVLWVKNDIFRSYQYSYWNSNVFRSCYPQRDRFFKK